MAERPKKKGKENVDKFLKEDGGSIPSARRKSASISAIATT